MYGSKMKVVARDHVHPSRDLLIPDDFSEITFGDGADTISISVRQGEVEVRSLHGRLVVLPGAANVIIVKSEW